MKRFFRITALISTALGFATTASAQSNQERCTNYDAYTLGVKDGSGGGVVGQADKRVNKCLKYGVTLDKTEYIRGVEQGQKSYCTAERGKQHVADNQTPAFACRMWDNPYMWAFRGRPLVRLPVEGAASEARAKQDLPLDLDYLRAVHRRANPDNSTSPYGSASLSLLQSQLETRIKTLEKQQAGQQVFPAAVNSPGPKYRSGPDTEEMLKGLFKASNWKSGNDLSPMRIRKKDCKAGL